MSSIISFFWGGCYLSPMQPRGFSPLLSFLSCMEQVNLEHPCPCDAESQRNFIVHRLPWTVFIWEFLVLSMSRRKPAFTLNWISMQPFSKSIFLLPSSHPPFLSFTHLHSVGSCNRPSRIFQSCLSQATLSGSSLEPPPRWKSSPVSSGSTPEVFFPLATPWIPPKGCTQVAPYSNPGSTSAGSLHSRLRTSDVKIPRSPLYRRKRSPSHCGSSFYVTVCAHYLGLHAEHMTRPGFTLPDNNCWWSLAYESNVLRENCLAHIKLWEKWINK